jgi:hypothetical protein
MMEVPAGFEPAVSELQSLALPLGYGTKACGYYSKWQLLRQSKHRQIIINNLLKNK